MLPCEYMVYKYNITKYLFQHIISNDIDIFLKTIKSKIDITFQKKISNDIDKSYFDQLYIKKLE